ncbi:hypothetical protein ACET3Z_022317 [Daucus carota]
MEPPTGFWTSLWRFICFLPFFIGLLLLGLLKGVILCPLICLLMTFGNSAIILGLWPVHCFWTYLCILRTKKFGPVLKLVLCVCIIVPLLLWPPVGILSSIIGGAAYGLLSPIFATFDAISEGNTDKFFHCIYDGTWDTITGCCTIIRDFKDVCYHSYFSYMDDLKRQGPQEEKYYEIRLLYLPGAIIVGALGLIVDFLVITFVAVCKFPYMLFKGWRRLFQDCIGREGPFLETMCVPFAGLAILLWPLAVGGALLASMLSSVFIGAYAAVIVYKESSVWLGLCYIVASLSIYDEYSNDVLDLPEGSCFPKPKYRKNAAVKRSTSRSNSSVHSFRKGSMRSGSIRAPLIELKPLEIIDGIINDLQHDGEIIFSQGVITKQDIEDEKINKNKAICNGLGAYSLLQCLLRSAKANAVGLLLADNTEITSTNRPTDTFFDWFLNPLLVMRDQIKAQSLSETEEQYLGRLALFIGSPEKLKISTMGSPPESEIKKAELNALAMRLQGISKSISRFPTYKRRFDGALKTIKCDHARKTDSSRHNADPETLPRSKSTFGQIFNLKYSRRKAPAADLETQLAVDKDVR